jgi:hypothetical protein
MSKNKGIIKKIGITLTIVLVIILLLLVSLRTSFMQNFLADKILSSLSENLDTDITIDDIRINFFDEATISRLLIKDQQNDTLLYADQVHVDISLFSFFNKTLHIDEATIDHPVVNISELEDGRYNFSFLFDLEEEEVASSNGEPWQFKLKEASIQDLTGTYTTKGQSITFQEEKLELDFSTFNIQDKIYALSDLYLSNGAVVLINRITGKNESPSTPFTLPDPGITIQIDNFDINEQSFVTISGPDSLKIEHLLLDGSDFSWNSNLLSGQLSSGSFITDKGLNLEDIEGHLAIDSNLVILNELKVYTNRDQVTLEKATVQIQPLNTTIDKLEAEISPATLALLKPYLPSDVRLLKGATANITASTLEYNYDQINLNNLNFKYGRDIQLSGNYRFRQYSNPERIQINADIRQLNIKQSTVKKTYPSLSIPDSLQRYETIIASGKISGPLNNLNLYDFNIDLDKKITSDFSGIIQNVLKPEEFTYDLTFNQVTTSISALPIPPVADLAIDKLGNLNYSGQLSGSRSTVNIEGILTSDLGQVNLNNRIALADQLEDLRYDGSVDFRNFDLGSLLKRDDLGTISLSTSLSGKGVNLTGLDSRINGTIESFTYKGYTYRNLTLDAIFSDCVLDGDLAIDDENISLTYSGRIDLTPGQIHVDCTADVDTINFAPLNLFNTKMGMKTRLKADFDVPISPGQKGRIAFLDLKMNDDQFRYNDDSLLIDLSRINQNTEIDITSNFLTGHIDGDYRLRELPDAFREIVRVYSPIPDSMEHMKPLQSKNIHFMGNLTSLDPINSILSDHEIFLRRGKIDVEIDLSDFRMKSNSRLDSLVFDGNLVEILQFRTDNNAELPNLRVEGYDGSTIGNISVPYFAINSQFKDRNVNADIIFEDLDNVPKLEVKTFWESQPNGELVLTIHDSLNLNNTLWNINENNRITFEDGIHINRLQLYNEKESMTIQSTDDKGNNMEVSFEDFDLRQWIELLASDPVDMSGLMNGTMELKDINNDFYFLINLTLSNIVYNKKPVGSVLFTANDDPASGIISGSFDLIGSENDIIGTGSFNPDTRQLNWDVYMGLLEMRLLDPFLEDIISESRGIMYGELKATGTLDRPDIYGELNFDNISTNVDLNNTRYNFDNHIISFSNTKIDIGQLTVYDQEENTALVSGIINHRFYNDFQLDLSLATDQFVFLNTTSRVNPIFYGKVILDTDISLTGPPDLVEVNANAVVMDNSSLTISPFSQTESILKEDFIRYGKPVDFENQSSRYLRQIARLYPYNVNMSLNVDEGSEFVFVVDPLSGDKLECKGKGNLRINFKPNGEQEIYGNYRVSEGAYSFSYGDFVNRDFKLLPGGTIQFNGNPLNAILDVEAVYTAYTSPYELIKNEVSLSESEINAARRRTDVEVLLSLSGSLLSPEIQLDIKVPELQAGSIVSVVDRKLNNLRNNPDELNNQVFALLVLNQFLSTESTSTGFDKVGQNIALSSISNLISSELNRLARNVIKGVDISIDVNSYNSQFLRESGSVNVTEVGLNVSKSLFNDRISISAGGNLNWDDYSLESGSFASFVGDFVLEYRLTESGNYRLRVFSKTDYDRLLNENTSRNGVSIYFSKDFDSKTTKQ